MIFIDYWLQQRTISNLQNVFLKGGLVLNMAARKRYQKVFAACPEHAAVIANWQHIGNVCGISPARRLFRARRP